jgi:hypothetical protein
MPIRTASLTRQIKKNGARLHLAMASRAYSQGADQPPSAQEKALLEERRLLKEARAERQVQAKLPRQKAVRWIKEAKPPKAPKAPKAPKEPKEAKATKGNKPSRADKLIRKAENLEAAKKAARKSARRLHRLLRLLHPPRLRLSASVEGRYFANTNIMATSTPIRKLASISPASLRYRHPTRQPGGPSREMRCWRHSSNGSIYERQEAPGKKAYVASARQ